MTAPEPTRPADEHTGTVALDLDAIEAAALADDGWWSVPVLTLVAEVRRLTAEAATQREWFEAADAAAERRLDQSIAWMERAEAAEAEVRRLTESRATVAANLAASLLLAENRAEAEVATLRAKVAAAEAEKEAILGQVDQAARLLRLNGKRADAQTVIAQVRRWPEFVDRAALATGEGE